MKAAITVLMIVCVPFILFSQNRYDIVIDEIMADPTPSVGLPGNEWIELKNTSSFPVNLQGWRIGDATSQSGALPNFTLDPGSFVIVCPVSAVAAMSAFGSTISVSGFPSLGNDGDQLYLRALNGLTIHAVNYSISWYGNQLKKDGGWTLEMVDPTSPCLGIANWKASTNSAGGTPGKRNSVDTTNSDLAAPGLRHCYAVDSLTIVAGFDEPVDSLKGARTSNYSINGGLLVIAATTIGPIFDAVQLKLNSPLVLNKVYQLTATNVTDCKGNVIERAKDAKVGLATEPAREDLVINEILFNPGNNAFDYVELYNRSDKIFDASKLYVANRDGSNVISSIKQMSTTPFYIFPGEYLVITEDATSLATNYHVQDPAAVIEMASLPSYPDDEGDVILLNGQGDVVDEVKYKDDWQFKLIDQADGVALERIDPGRSSQDPANWHSAASTAGFGTPGYRNSQFKQMQSLNATILVAQKIFSPDNDGLDDITTIQYQLTDPGWVANTTIFDAAGRPVRYLIKNATLGLQGQWNWDGLDEKGNKLPIGIYVIFTEIFDLQGKKQQFKNVVVLARKLN